MLGAGEIRHEVNTPDALCRNCEQQYVHCANYVGGWELWTNRTDAFWKCVVLEKLGIAVVSIEVLYEALGPRPHEDIVRGVCEVVSETASKVARAEDEDTRLFATGGGGRGHSEAAGLDEAGKGARLMQSGRTSLARGYEEGGTCRDGSFWATRQGAYSGAPQGLHSSSIRLAIRCLACTEPKRTEPQEPRATWRRCRRRPRRPSCDAPSCLEHSPPRPLLPFCSSEPTTTLYLYSSLLVACTCT